MKYVVMDIHTNNIAYTVLSEKGELLMKGKINNTINDINRFPVKRRAVDSYLKRMQRDPNFKIHAHKFRHTLQ